MNDRATNNEVTTLICRTLIFKRSLTEVEQSTKNMNVLNSIPSVFVVLPPIRKEALNVDHLHLSTFL